MENLRWLPALALVDGTVNFNENRMIIVASGSTWFTLSADSMMCHHMSYVRSDDEMLRKIQSFSHADDVISDWYEEIWLGNAVKDLHPIAGPCFKRAVPALKYKLELWEQ